MVVRLTSYYRACKCASTSTSLPCKHVPFTSTITHQHHHHQNFSTTSSIQLEKQKESESTSTEGGEIHQSHTRALEFTAPLWKDNKWFIPMGNNWRWWMKKSQTLSTKSFTAAPTKAFVDMNTLSNESTGKSVKINNGDLDIAITKYLSLREPNHRYLLSLNEFSLAQLVKALERKELPTVQQLLLNDMMQMKQSKMKVSAINDEVLEKDVSKSTEVSKDVGSTFSAPIGQLIQQQEVEMVEKKELIPEKKVIEEIVPDLSLFVDATQELKDLVELGYRDRQLSYALKVARPLDSSIQILEELWSTFVYSKGEELSNSPQDLHLAYSFLLHLVSPVRSSNPSSAQSPTDYFPLALVVFRYLVENVIPETSVALPEPDSSRAITLQKVFLRTIISASLDEGFYDLAYSTLDSLAILRESNPPILIESDSVDTDLVLLQQTLNSLLTILSNDRQDTYRPTVPFTSSFDSTPLGQVYSLLLSLLPRWTPTSTSIEKSVSETTDQVLCKFVDEAALRNRWDLVASIWSYWGDATGGKGWIMPRRRRKLLRWLGGVAPYATYGYQYSDEVKTIRSIQKSEFGDLAGVTYVNALKGIDKMEISNWSTREKSDWIEVLCASRAANGRSRDLARRFALLFIKMNPLGSVTPFVFTPTSLLALVRASTSPVDQIDRSSFTTQIINHFIASITSPSSPYAPATLPDTPVEIDHYDLTTLAHVYSLMGDLVSVSQVYKKVLAQKMLPDQADIKLIIQTSSRHNPTFAKSFLALASTIGIEVNVDLYKEAMLGLVVHYRQKDLPYENQLNALLDQVFKTKLLTSEKRRLLHAFKKELLIFNSATALESYESNPEPIFSAIGLGKYDRRQEIILSALIPIMIRIVKEKNWKLAILVYEKIQQEGTLEENIYQQVIYLLIEMRQKRYNHKSGILPSRNQSVNYLKFIDRKIRYFTDHLALNSTPTIKQIKTFEVAILGSLSLRDTNAAFRLLRYKKHLGMRISEEVRLKIRAGLFRLGKKEEFEALEASNSI